MLRNILRRKICSSTSKIADANDDIQPKIYFKIWGGDREREKEREREEKKYCLNT